MFDGFFVKISNTIMLEDKLINKIKECSKLECKSTWKIGRFFFKLFHYIEAQKLKYEITKLLNTVNRSYIELNKIAEAKKINDFIEKIEFNFNIKQLNVFEEFCEINKHIALLGNKKDNLNFINEIVLNISKINKYSCKSDKILEKENIVSKSIKLMNFIIDKYKGNTSLILKILKLNCWKNLSENIRKANHLLIEEQKKSIEYWYENAKNCMPCYTKGILTKNQIDNVKKIPEIKYLWKGQFFQEEQTKVIQSMMINNPDEICKMLPEDSRALIEFENQKYIINTMEKELNKSILSSKILIDEITELKKHEDKIIGCRGLKEQLEDLVFNNEKVSQLEEEIQKKSNELNKNRLKETEIMLTLVNERENLNILQNNLNKEITFEYTLEINKTIKHLKEMICEVKEIILTIDEAVRKDNDRLKKLKQLLEKFEFQCAEIKNEIINISKKITELDLKKFELNNNLINVKSNKNEYKLKIKEIEEKLSKIVGNFRNKLQKPLLEIFENIQDPLTYFDERFDEKINKIFDIHSQLILNNKFSFHVINRFKEIVKIGDKKIDEINKNDEKKIDDIQKKINLLKEKAKSEKEEAVLFFLEKCLIRVKSMFDATVFMKMIKEKYPTVSELPSSAEEFNSANISKLLFWKVPLQNNKTAEKEMEAFEKDCKTNTVEKKSISWNSVDQAFSLFCNALNKQGISYCMVETTEKNFSQISLKDLQWDQITPSGVEKTLQNNKPSDLWGYIYESPSKGLQEGLKEMAGFFVLAKNYNNNAVNRERQKHKKFLQEEVNNEKLKPLKDQKFSEFVASALKDLEFINASKNLDKDSLSKYWLEEAEKVRQLKKEMEDFKNTISTYDKEEGDFEIQLNDLAKEQQSLQKKLSELESCLSELEESNYKSRQKIEELNSKMQLVNPS